MSGESEKGSAGGISLLYQRLVLAGPMPGVIVALFVGLAVFFSFQLRDFKLDASNESMILQGDADKRYYDASRLLFSTDDFVVVVIQGESIEDLVSDESLGMIDRLEKELRAMKNVVSTLSILDVPLFESPPPAGRGMARFMKLRSEGYNTLRAPGTDRALAARELTESPLYSDYLVGGDGRSVAILVNFNPDRDFMKLDHERTTIKARIREGTATEGDRARLKELTPAWTTRHYAMSEERRADIDRIREIMARFERENPAIGHLEQGGIPLVIADMVNYVESDIKVFGAAALFLMMITLAIIFRKARWVALPTLACLVTGLTMLGFLSSVNWHTTIISSNFSSLLLILTMSMAIHLTVKYRELYSRDPDRPNRELVLDATRAMFMPCLYMALTSMVGFGSLLVSGIPPVMDFGSMMALGLVYAFLVCFLFYPAMMMLTVKGRIPPGRLGELERHSRLTLFARVVERRGGVIVLGSVAVLAVCGYGVTRLDYDARFLDYFREDTPICRSLTLIDTKMGGTLPLEVVLEGKPKEPGDRFWLEPDSIRVLGEIHEWLDAHPSTGKVLSLDTLNRILVRVNDGKPVSRMIIDMAMEVLPDSMRESILLPYVTPDFSQARFVIRFRESQEGLERAELRRDIEDFLNSYEGMDFTVGGNAHVTGYFILYNNMVLSLFTSQITTTAAVLGAVWLMFLLLFRNFRLATISMIPNLFPVALMLGTMGLLGIHMDMMTIMIAAVTLGIAVDDTIHYAHRFGEEFRTDRDYHAAMYRCHNSIGRAMFYTSVIILSGFSILSLSKFVPTVYFGIFTGLAMFVAFFANILLLPLLIIRFKPFGPGVDPHDRSRGRRVDWTAAEATEA